MRLPEKFVMAMQERLGDEFDEYLQCLHAQRYYGLRANTLKISAAHLHALLGLPDERVAWCPDGLYYTEGYRPAKSVFYHAGLFYIQEPSAMSAASMLDIHPGDKVLDICAAPGGKSTQIGAKLANTGLLVSNDISASRLKALVKNIELSGIRNAVVLNEPPARLTAAFTAYFDKIIIDAPCSGEGMFRKDPDAVKSWAEYKPRECCAMQKEILSHCAIMLREGGEMVYSTCTFSADENEGMIDWFLNTYPDFEILPLPVQHTERGLRPGRPEWGGGRDAMARCGRIWPHKAKGEGHFVCLLRKTSFSGIASTEKNIPTSYGKQNKIDGIKNFHDFCRATLHEKIEGYFICRGTALYLAPPGLPDLAGIRVARSGWYLGDIRTKRFEPSQAFAMGLTKSAAIHTLDFTAASQEAMRYLKGESFPMEGQDGWYLVCLQGFPLGWGKMVQGRMKNKHAKGWRIE